jgi:hypothetical protein
MPEPEPERSKEEEGKRGVRNIDSETRCWEQAPSKVVVKFRAIIKGYFFSSTKELFIYKYLIHPQQNRQKSLKMSQKLIKIFFSSPTLECQFNLIQFVC